MFTQSMDTSGRSFPSPRLAFSEATNKGVAEREKKSIRTYWDNAEHALTQWVRKHRPKNFNQLIFF